MKWRWGFFSFFLLGSPALAQEVREPLPPPSVPGIPERAPVLMDAGEPTFFAAAGPAERPATGLSGNRNFPNFIGFLSNPLQNIEPRAMTALWPLFLSNWLSTPPPALPDGNFQLYGAGLYVALSDRFSFGLNQGGGAAADFERDARPRPFLDRFGRRRDAREFSGQREGWLNLGGFAQYTLIEDVPNQFLLTAGLRWEAPSGSRAVFQGSGPAHLAPYVTVGKELGQFHVLATTGYEFAAGSGELTTNLFYANLHLDWQVFGWLYPLVELNWTYHTSSVDAELVTHRGFIDSGNFTSSGNILTLAVGANAVLVRERLEVGAVYSTPLATQRNFDFNGLLVKMLIRY